MRDHVTPNELPEYFKHASRLCSFQIICFYLTDKLSSEYSTGFCKEKRLTKCPQGWEC